MAKIVGAISMSHAPGMSFLSDALKPAVLDRMITAYNRIAHYIDDLKPDLIIAILDDHFENHARMLMPALSIGIADQHSGPAEYFLALLQMEKPVAIAGDAPMATYLLRCLMADGFDLARMGSVEYGNNLMTPLMHIRPAFDIPVVPIFINVFTPPLISTTRAAGLGRALKKAIDDAPTGQRVLLLATGGLSHWPPFWMESETYTDPFFERMERFQSLGRSVIAEDPDLLTDLGAYEVQMAKEGMEGGRILINAEWDRKFLRALVENDIEFLKSLANDDIIRDAGSGGMEVLNWITLHAASDEMNAEVLDYEAVIEWMCGIGFVIYH